MKINTQDGVSLVEVMVAITIMAILSSVALPAFDNMIMTNRLRSYANTFLASVHLARGEAVKRNAQVTMCVSSDGLSCNAGGWELGWIVMSGATVLSRQEAINPDYKMTEVAGLNSLNFRSTGIGATQATVTVCRATPTVGNEERIVRVTVTGKASVTKSNSGTCA